MQRLRTVLRSLAMFSDVMLYVQSSSALSSLRERERERERERADYFARFVYLGFVSCSCGVFYLRTGIVFL